MKNTQTHYRNASFLALLFVILGYVIKFYPEYVTDFDNSVQTAMRGNLPSFATTFWTKITVVGNVVPLMTVVILLALFFYWKKWKAEAIFIVGALFLMVGASTALKFLYQRSRPSIEWLVNTTGDSFPSWHTASTMLIAGVLAIIIHQRMNSLLIRSLLQGALLFVAVLVALSRIYVGVHYPTDIVGGWLLALCLLEVLYPTYDRIRFTWRFQNKQK